MAALQKVVSLLLLFICLVKSLRITAVEEPSCIVHTDEGVLNLSKLAGPQHPAFAFVFDTVYTLYWNPCKDVMPIFCSGSGGSGESLFGTSIGSGPSICKNLGMKADSLFTVNNNNQLVLNYKGRATVTFICKPTAHNNTFSVPNADDKTTAELIGPGSCLKTSGAEELPPTKSQATVQSPTMSHPTKSVADVEDLSDLGSGSDYIADDEIEYDY